MGPSISQLFIYPIKSCAGISVQEFQFDHKGPLFDRRWMLVDASTGQFLSQRELPRMGLISTRLDDGLVYARQSINSDLAIELCLPAPDAAALSDDEALVDVQVWDDDVKGFDCGDEAATWFSALLDCSCRLVYQGECGRFASTKYAEEGTQVGFADGFPLLVVAQSSIDFLDAECEGAEISAVNFRPNIVVNNTEQFEEKRWNTLAVSSLSMNVVKPCERCVIPALNPKTALREKSILPVLIAHCRENKKIIFGQNLTFQLTDGAQLKVGQSVDITSC